MEEQLVHRPRGPLPPGSLPLLSQPLLPHLPPIVIEQNISVTQLDNKLSEARAQLTLKKKVLTILFNVINY